MNWYNGDGSLASDQGQGAGAQRETHNVGNSRAIIDFGEHDYAAEADTFMKAEPRVSDPNDMSVGAQIFRLAQDAVVDEESGEIMTKGGGVPGGAQKGGGVPGRPVRKTAVPAESRGYPTDKRQVSNDGEPGDADKEDFNPKTKDDDDPGDDEERQPPEKPEKPEAKKSLDFQVFDDLLEKAGDKKPDYWRTINHQRVPFSGTPGKGEQLAGHPALTGGKKGKKGGDAPAISKEQKQQHTLSALKKLGVEASTVGSDGILVHDQKDARKIRKDYNLKATPKGDGAVFSADKMFQAFGSGEAKAELGKKKQQASKEKPVKGGPAKTTKPKKLPKTLQSPLRAAAKHGITPGGTSATEKQYYKLLDMGYIKQGVGAATITEAGKAALEASTTPTKSKYKVGDKVGKYGRTVLGHTKSGKHVVGHAGTKPEALKHTDESEHGAYHVQDNGSGVFGVYFRSNKAQSGELIANAFSSNLEAAKKHIAEHKAKHQGGSKKTFSEQITEQHKKSEELFDDLVKASQPSDSANISPEKARQILHDGTVHGKPITEQQRKFFGAIGGHLPAPGKKTKKAFPLPKPDPADKEAENKQEKQANREAGLATSKSMSVFDDLVKATPVGGTTPGGYKKVAPGKYVKEGEGKGGGSSKILDKLEQYKPGDSTSTGLTFRGVRMEVRMGRLAESGGKLGGQHYITVKNTKTGKETGKAGTAAEVAKWATSGAMASLTEQVLGGTQPGGGKPDPAKHAKEMQEIVDSVGGMDKLKNAPIAMEAYQAARKKMMAAHEAAAAAHAGPKTEKSMTEANALLNDFLEKADGQGGFPEAGNPPSSMPTKTRPSDGAPAAGSPNSGGPNASAPTTVPDGVDRVSGRSTEGYKNSPYNKPGMSVLSEDDEIDEKQMMNHQKPLEKRSKPVANYDGKMRKSEIDATVVDEGDEESPLMKAIRGSEFARTALAQRADAGEMDVEFGVGVARQDPIEKAQPWAQSEEGEYWRQKGGVVLYGDGEDKHIEKAMAVGGDAHFYQTPTVNFGTNMHKSVGCGACGSQTPVIFSSCQNCGVDIMAKSDVEGHVTGPQAGYELDEEVAKSLRPSDEQDIFFNDD